MRPLSGLYVTPEADVMWRWRIRGSLSGGWKMTEAGLLVGWPLEVGDARPAEARIVSVTNASEGRL
jgi:hypothetical protein